MVVVAKSLHSPVFVCVWLSPTPFKALTATSRPVLVHLGVLLPLFRHIMLVKCVADNIYLFSMARVKQTARTPAGGTSCKTLIAILGSRVKEAEDTMEVVKDKTRQLLMKVRCGGQ